jgi:hypothetical protein
MFARRHSQAQGEHAWPCRLWVWVRCVGTRRCAHAPERVGFPADASAVVSPLHPIANASASAIVQCPVSSAEAPCSVFRVPLCVPRFPAGVYQDVVGAAETGSGKTLAFGIPVLQRLLELRRAHGMPVLRSNDARASTLPRWGLLPALILTPTRELALQIKCVRVCVDGVRRMQGGG